MADVMIEVMNKSDDYFFEVLTKVVFYTGFHRGVVERKWECFKEAFCGFAIAKVAEFNETDIERLLAKDSPIIKNARKVMATVENAKVCRQLIAEYGSLSSFLQFVQGHSKRSLEGEFKLAFQLVGESAAHALFEDLRVAMYIA